MARKVRCNMCLDEDLIKRIDQKAESLSLSRSAYVSMVLTQNFQTEKMVESVPQLLSAVGALKDILSASSHLSLAELIDSEKE